MKVLVIGLDAATMDLIEPWAQAGHLPVLSFPRFAWERLFDALRRGSEHAAQASVRVTLACAACYGGTNNENGQT